MSVLESVTAIGGRIQAHLLDRARLFWAFVVYVVKRYSNDRCYQIAGALTFTSLLAIVPLMTISFAIFSAFPAFEDIEDELQAVIFRNLVPQVGDVVLEYVNEFVQQAAGLTTFGIIGLAVSSLLLLWTIESAFNAIWRASEDRPVLLRILSFWSILTMAPLLFAASVSVSSDVFVAAQTMGLDEDVRQPLLRFYILLPFVLEVIAFTLIFVIIPNRTVRWRDAVVGAIVASLALEILKWGFRIYLTEAQMYQTVYGALATLPIFLVWLYSVWSTVLFGGVVAASMPDWRRGGRLAALTPSDLSPSERLMVALAILYRLNRASLHGIGVSRERLSSDIPVGTAILDDVLVIMEKRRWIAPTRHNEWVVTRDLERARLYDLHRSIGAGLAEGGRDLGLDNEPWSSRYQALRRRADGSLGRLLDVSLNAVLRDDRQSSSLDHLATISDPAETTDGAAATDPDDDRVDTSAGAGRQG